jgi:hypothetical protein
VLYSRFMASARTSTKTVSITEAKRQLSRLAQSSEPVQVTVRGQRVGLLRIYAEPKRDPAAARAAFKRLQKLAATRKPSRKNGAIKAIRDLRDRGE